MNTNQNFIESVKSIFHYLIPLGFKLNDIEIKLLYIKIRFEAKNVAIAFVYDIRDNEYDCYVGKIINGELVTNKTQNGYWAHLQNYLFDFHNWRWGLVLKPEGGPLHRYKAMLNLAPKLLNDSVDAFDPDERMRKHWREIELSQMRQKLDIAWHAKNYAGVVKLLSPLQDVLTPSELHKLKYASNKRKPETENKIDTINDEINK